MKKVFKIYLSCMMVLLIYILALPIGACAATEYNLYVNGEQFTSDKLSINCASGTATFVPSTNTLTLNNATITKGAIIKIASDQYNKENYTQKFCGIYSEIDNLKIIIKGNCKISLTNLGKKSTPRLDLIAGIFTENNLVISGNNKLEINIEDITYSTNYEGHFSVVGIYANSLEINDSNIKANINSVSISNNSSISFNSIETGMDCILNSCNITAKCNVTFANPKNNHRNCKGISVVGTLTLNKSNITAFGNTSGIICNTFNGNSGVVNSSSKSAIDNSSCGFYAFTLNLNGATINATAENSNLSEAVYAYNANIKSGTINAECIGTSLNSYGLLGYVFNMTGGNITASACQVANGGTDSCGIRSKEDFTISGGNLISSGYTASINSSSYNISKYKSPEIYIDTKVDSKNPKKTKDFKDIESALYVKISSKSHSHSFSDKWSFDDTGHWHNATCGHSDKDNYAAHTLNNNVCKICGYKKTVNSQTNNISSANVSSKNTVTPSISSDINSSINSSETNISSKFISSNTISIDMVSSENNNSFVDTDVVSNSTSNQSIIDSNQNSNTTDNILTIIWVSIGVLIAIIATPIIIIKKKK
ncbi:MAG: hypothetical protein IKV36_00890 [Clostridia bacterium]|nr:hypothetical protein [Clostridia bacterium]